MERTHHLIAQAWRPMLAYVLGGAAVVVCYLFVDRPVAWFLHRHHAVPRPYLERLAYAAAEVNFFLLAGTIAAFACGLILRGRQGRLLLALALSVLLTEGSKDVLKWSFGRPAPPRWFELNPAAGPSGVCGFYPFHTPGPQQSFPSGHEAITFSAIAVLWLGWPRGRVAYLAAGVLMGLVLVAANVHFVGDVIAGAMLGLLIGSTTAKLFRVSDRTECPE